jgi:hypothetical protein
MAYQLAHDDHNADTAEQRIHFTEFINAAYGARDTVRDHPECFPEHRDGADCSGPEAAVTRMLEAQLDVKLLGVPEVADAADGLVDVLMEQKEHSRAGAGQAEEYDAVSAEEFDLVMEETCVALTDQTMDECVQAVEAP